MEKLKMHSGNVTSSNIEALAQIFPDCITEATDENGQVIQAVDFDKLKATLSSKIVEGSQERYNFTWPQKSDAIRLANARTSKTLRPCREESLDFDNTGNLYIEGDNLDVLKVLRNTYRSRVKMIYIDPPYNTGNDFVYEDDFTMDSDEFLHLSGQKDNDGNRLVVNSNSNGRFHTDWLNMIYPRLKVARDILTDDGVIFISIDDNEVDRLYMMCCEIFGEANIISKLIWKRKQGGANDSGHIAVEHEYILVVAKNINAIEILPDHTTVIDLKNYPFEDSNGRYGLVTLDKSSIQISNSLIYEITGPDGTIYRPRIIDGKQSCWRWSKAKVENEYDKLVFKDGKIYTKFYVPNGVKQRSLLIDDVYGRNASGGADIKKLFNSKPFSYPKPVSLVSHLISIACKEGVVLDFFSGSATTAHAVMKLNAQDHGHRQFVMVQIPEEVAKNSEAFNAGYKNICEIGKERIRRAGAKIKAELGDKAKDLDVGFRVLKLDSSNMEDAFYLPHEMSLESLISDNIKPDRTSEDLLFQTMLETDVLLSSSIRVEHINTKEVFVVRDGYLMACFDEHIDLATVKAIAERKPAYFITRDGSMASDDVADNMEQIFIAISPNTTIKVL